MSGAGDALAEWTAERQRLTAEVTRLRGAESDLLQRIEGDQTQLSVATTALDEIGASEYGVKPRTWALPALMVVPEVWMM